MTYTNHTFHGIFSYWQQSRNEKRHSVPLHPWKMLNSIELRCKRSSLPRTQRTMMTLALFVRVTDENETPAFLLSTLKSQWISSSCSTFSFDSVHFCQALVNSHIDWKREVLTNSSCHYEPSRSFALCSSSRFLLSCCSFVSGRSFFILAPCSSLQKGNPECLDRDSWALRPRQNNRSHNDNQTHACNWNKRGRQVAPQVSRHPRSVRVVCDERTVVQCSDGVPFLYSLSVVIFSYP